MHTGDATAVSDTETYLGSAEPALGGEALAWIAETEAECKRLLAQASEDSQRLRDAGKAELDQALAIAQQVRDEAEEYARRTKSEARVQYAQISTDLQRLRGELQGLLDGSSVVLRSLDQARGMLDDGYPASSQPPAGGVA